MKMRKFQKISEKRVTTSKKGPKLHTTNFYEKNCFFREFDSSLTSDRMFIMGATLCCLGWQKCHPRTNRFFGYLISILETISVALGMEWETTGSDTQIHLHFLIPHIRQNHDFFGWNYFSFLFTFISIISFWVTEFLLTVHFKRRT